MRKLALAVAFSFVLLLTAGVATARDPRLTDAAPATDWPHLALRRFASDLYRPLHITHANDNTGRLFVVEQEGAVRIIKNGVLLPEPFLDIQERVGCCGEQGLLSIAFPPDFVNKQHFYVNYTDRIGDTTIARFHVRPENVNRADAESEEIILTVAQPYSNHNGGQIAFSPTDGMLYIGMGDGGSGGDPHNYGQSPGTLLGKLLRIDVEAGADPYAIPPGNPFSATTDFRGEVWALGLRNPWRFSFDRLTGDLYLGDVGQSVWEEIDYQPASSKGGENYGWRLTEGSHCFEPLDCDPTGLVAPVAEYDHSLGCAVTGGYVYRGDQHRQMQGVYFFADYCSGRIWGLRRQDEVWQTLLLFDAPFPIASFGEDQAGEIYVTDFPNGVIYWLTELHRLWAPIWVQP